MSAYFRSNISLLLAVSITVSVIVPATAYGNLPLVADSAQEISDGLIAFVSTDGNIWSIRPDGSDLRQITFDAELGTNVRYPIVGYSELKWSPDGRLLGARRQARDKVSIVAIQATDLETSTLISDVDGSFDWLPDSRSFVFSNIPYEAQQRGTHPGGLSILQLDTGKITPIIDPGPNLRLVRPDWSPIGEHVFFDIEPAPWPDMMWAATLGVAKTLDDHYTEIDQVWSPTCDWSPDGEQIVCGNGILEVTGPQLVILTTSGMEVGRIPEANANSSDAVRSPLWSPNGRFIAYERIPCCSYAGSVLDIAEMKDGKVVSVSTIHGNYSNLAWSPDSSRLLALRDPYVRASELVIIDTKTLNIVDIANGSQATWQPAVQADPSPWLEEKAGLVSQLRQVDIPTDLFTVPAVSAYNETAANNLLHQIRTQSEQGMLNLEQLEAFARLTVQERALAQMLPEYTGVAATISDASADSVEILLSVIFILRPAWNKCREAIPFCGRIQAATEKIVWRLIRDTGKLVARLFGSSPDLQETGAKVWDLLVRLIESKYAKGSSLMDLLVDTAVQAAVTYAMIQPYLIHTQDFLDKGVDTADLDSTAIDRWPITGDTERAELRVDSLVQQAEVERETALGRHQDFQRAANILQFAEDISDLATLTPLAFFGKAVGLGARVENLIVNLTLIFANLQNLECAEYLSTRAAEAAFDAAQPFESCLNRSGLSPSRTEKVNYVTQHFTVPSQNKWATALQEEASKYRQAIETLVEALQGQDTQAIEKAAEQLMLAESAFSGTLEETQAILLAQEPLDKNALTLLRQSRSFAIRNLELYLAIAETLMARNEGGQPKTDADKVAQLALTAVDEIQREADGAKLMPPASKSILVIRRVESEGISPEQVKLDVEVSNVGTVEAVDAKVLLTVDGETVGPPVTIGTGVIAAGERAHATLSIPAQDGAMFTLQVWTQDILMDTYQENILLAIAIPPGASVSAQSSDIVGEIESAVKSTSPEVLAYATPTELTNSIGSQQQIGVLVVVGLVVLLVVGSVLWISLRRRRAG